MALAFSISAPVVNQSYFAVVISFKLRFLPPLWWTQSLYIASPLPRSDPCLKFTGLAERLSSRPIAMLNEAEPVTRWGSFAVTSWTVEPNQHVSRGSVNKRGRGEMCRVIHIVDQSGGKLGFDTPVRWSPGHSAGKCASTSPAWSPKAVV